MKLQQLRFLVAIAKNNLNISEAAEHLYTSQPGVSKQIKLLEEELGVEIFTRNGKHLTRITPAGQRIIEHAERVLSEVRNIRSLSSEYKDDEQGVLTIATTHTQARYILPSVVTAFRQQYPDVDLHLNQGTPKLIAEMAVTGEAEFAIATEALSQYPDLLALPVFRWNRCIVVPRNHLLAKYSDDPKKLTLEDIAQYSIVTYVKALTGRGLTDDAFAAAGLKPDLVLTATDADVIKTYVRLGLGIGLIARMAYEKRSDSDLVTIDAEHLFKNSITKIAFRRGTYLRGYMYRFLEEFAAHLKRDFVDELILTKNQNEVDHLFKDIILPEY